MRIQQVLWNTKRSFFVWKLRTSRYQSMFWDSYWDSIRERISLLESVNAFRSIYRVVFNSGSDNYIIILFSDIFMKYSIYFKKICFFIKNTFMSVCYCLSRYTRKLLINKIVLLVNEATSCLSSIWHQCLMTSLEDVQWAVNIYYS